MDSSAWIGKEVILFFQDLEKVLRKEGIVKDYDSCFVTLQTFSGTQIIPLSRVLRIEVCK